MKNIFNPASFLLYLLTFLVFFLTGATFVNISGAAKNQGLASGAIVVGYALMFSIVDDPLQALAGERPVSESQRIALTERFHLDEPFIVQYGYYMKNIVTGNLGVSFFQKEPVWDVLMDVFPNTVILTGFALLIAYIWGVLMGALLAWKRGSLFESGGLLATLMTRAAPEFFVGMLLLSFFSFNQGWFPSAGISKPGVIFDSVWQQLASGDFWRHMILPALTMAMHAMVAAVAAMRTVGVRCVLTPLATVRPVIRPLANPTTTTAAAPVSHA